MDKDQIYKKLNAAIRADKSLDFLIIKDVVVECRRRPINLCFCGFRETPPIEVSVIVKFHSNEMIE